MEGTARQLLLLRTKKCRRPSSCTALLLQLLWNCSPSNGAGDPSVPLTPHNLHVLHTRHSSQAPIELES